MSKKLIRQIKIYSDKSCSVVVPDDSTPPPAPAVELRKMRVWGDPVMVKYGYDYNLVGSNFQNVRCYSPDTDTWDAIGNFINLGQVDMKYLLSIQPTNDPNWTPEQKMGWLVYDKSGTRIYWGGNWRTSSVIKWGTTCLGGNIVQVEKHEVLNVKNPLNSKQRVNMAMAKLVGFLPSDRSRQLSELIALGLVHRAYCVGKKNTVVDSPKGIVYTPFYDPRGWRSGSVRDTALYVADEMLV